MLLPSWVSFWLSMVSASWKNVNSVRFRSHKYGCNHRNVHGYGILDSCRRWWTVYYPKRTKSRYIMRDSFILCHEKICLLGFSQTNFTAIQGLRFEFCKNTIPLSTFVIVWIMQTVNWFSLNQLLVTYSQTETFPKNRSAVAEDLHLWIILMRRVAWNHIGYFEVLRW